VVIQAVVAALAIGDIMKRDSFSSYCGEEFNALTYPLTCEECRCVTYNNPKPVVVLLVPVKMNIGDDGLLVIRRDNEPGRGELALPGGYLECGETWQEGAARELLEETNQKVNPKTIHAVGVETSAATSNLIVFGMSERILENELKLFIPNSEVSEVVAITKPISLAFPLHNNMVERFFNPGYIFPGYARGITCYQV
jgi:8-oxo-dGTP pyrophosphatase MutT (NUDIX family)